MARITIQQQISLKPIQQQIFLREKKSEILNKNENSFFLCVCVCVCTCVCVCSCRMRMIDQKKKSDEGKTNRSWDKFPGTEYCFGP